VRVGVLCLPANGFSIDDSIVESYVVWNSLVRFDLACNRISLGYQGFFYICRTVCEEGKETTGSVSCVLFLLDSRMADSTILMENLFVYYIMSGSS
jgi:hypothetical protein